MSKGKRKMDSVNVHQEIRRQTGTWTDTSVNRQTYSMNRQTDRWTDTSVNRQTFG